MMRMHKKVCESERKASYENVNTYLTDLEMTNTCID